VFEDIDLSIRDGEFVALVGRNGSGKTTLAKTLAGIYKPTDGTVQFEGQLLSSYKPKQLAERIGYVFQNPDQQLFAATVAEEVAFGPTQLGYSRSDIAMCMEQALASVGLEGYEQRDPVLMSKGVRQRISIASVLVTQPRVLILDEPTKGLDYTGQTKFLAMLKKLHANGHTIVLITHSMWVVAEHCSRLMVMQEGRLVFDGPVRAAFADADIARSRGTTATELITLSNLLDLKQITMDGIEAELRRRGAANGYLR
jgi:energy-coupling factor transport system ATP-binding protein